MEITIRNFQDQFITFDSETFIISNSNRNDFIGQIAHTNPLPNRERFNIEQCIIR
jgi:hypothetical protein